MPTLRLARAGRFAFCNTLVLFGNNYSIETEANGFGDVSYSELTLLPELVDYLHVRCLCYLEPMKKKEGQFVDVETPTSNTLTKAIGQFEQMVVAVEQRRSDPR